MTEMALGRVEATSAVASASFDAFYRQEWSRAVRYGWVLTGDLPAAEDLAQDAFVAAQRRWDSISGYERPDAWIRRAMTNRSASRARRLANEARAKLRLRPDIRISVELPEAADHVWEAVRSLSPRQMHVVTLAYLEDRSDNEIATILDLGVDTVRTHKRRAELRLAELLDDEPETTTGDLS